MKEKKRERGQSTVEFALVLPVLILLVCGIMDFGWLFYNKIEINNAAREGARYAVVHHKESGYAGTAQSIVTNFSHGAAPSVSDNGDSITVSASKNVPVLTGVTSTFLGSSVTLNASCTMKKEG